VSEDLLAGLDGLQGDMAAHQARSGGHVTAEANRTLAADAIERLDRQMAEEAGRIQPKQPELVAPPVDQGNETRDIEDKRYLISKAQADDVKLRNASPAEAWFLAHAMPRVELMLSKLDTGPLGEPSWNQRTMAVMAVKERSVAARTSNMIGLADDLDRRFTFELMQLLEDSTRVFGDWKKDPERRIQVGG
jgi:hypothetical protein